MKKKYKIEAEQLEDFDCAYLIDAVCRYMNAVKEPSVEAILPILAIKEVSEE